MTSSNRLVVVTGATGFVGRVFVARLMNEPDVTVRCMVRPGSDASALRRLDGEVDIVVGDITQPETLPEAFEGAWGVVNLAGYREFWSRSRKQFYALNEGGAKNVFRACLASGVSKVVQVSTPLAFGVPDRIPFDENTTAGPHPSDYARSKYLGDAAGWRMLEEESLPLTIVYLAAVIGAGDDKSTMEVRRAVDRKLPALVGADTTYTYVYVGDAAEAITRALLKEDAIGKRYLIGDQRATTREYFELIGDIANVPIPSWNIPETCLLPVARGMEWLSRRTGRRPAIPLDVIKTTAAGSLLFDSSCAARELGMRYTPLKAALAEAVEEIRAT